MTKCDGATARGEPVADNVRLTVFEARVEALISCLFANDLIDQDHFQSEFLDKMGRRGYVISHDDDD